MKKLLVAVMLALVSTGAMAEWTAVSEDEELTHYVDLATIRKSGDKVKMWLLKDYKTVQEGAAGEKYLSAKVQGGYDCKEEQWRLLAVTLFSEQGIKGSHLVLSGNKGVTSCIMIFLLGARVKNTA